MGFIAIVGSGALGGAVAHALAMRDRVPEVRLIDTAGSIARGKALDIQHSAPIDNFSTTLTAGDSIVWRKNGVRSPPVQSNRRLAPT